MSLVDTLIVLAMLAQGGIAMLLLMRLGAIRVPLVMRGKVSNDDYSGGMRIVADELYDLQLAREARARALRVRLNGQADAAKLRQMLNPFRAEPENGILGVPVDIVYRSKAGFECTMRLSEDWRVRMADTLLENLAGWARPDGVEVTY